MEVGSGAASAETAAVHYDRATIALHWTTAILVGLLWAIGQTIDFAPRGPLRTDYRSVHIVCGVALACVFVARAIWRLTRGRRLPAVGNALMEFVARWTHRALYLLVLVTLVLGLANASLHNDSIFNLFALPSFSSDKALRGMIGNWHALAANTTLIVAGLHAAAALFHHAILRDDILRRMLPTV